MHEAITKAIAQVMEGVPRLAKGERNSHGNYNFASIDDFLEAVRPLMAKAGLVIASDETDFEVIGESRDAWLKMVFAFTVHCGGQDAGPFNRTGMVRASMGSQAMGAAQSYAEKQFLRSLFKIATGEGATIDADSHQQAQLPEFENGSGRQKREPLKGKHKTREAMRQAAGNIAKALEEAADGGDDSFIDAVLEEWRESIDQIREEGPAGWWSNGDYGLEAQIAKARQIVAEKQ